MKIIVCVKKIDFLYFHYGVDAKAGNVDSEKTVPMLNLYDEIAVEESICIKESFDDVEIILITVGSESSEPFLRYAFAFGADKMIRVNGKSSDPWETATTLAKIIKNLEYDLILCGEKTIDQNSQLVGTLLAERLDLPQVSGIVDLKLNIQKRKVTVERNLGKGNREVIECSLPALFTAAIGLNDPRYPTLPNRLRAEIAPIQIISLMEMDPPASDWVGKVKDTYLSPLKPKPKPIFTPNATLPAHERMRQVIMGNPTEKKGIFLEGTPEIIAKKIIDILDQHNYLKNDGIAKSHKKG